MSTIVTRAGKGSALTWTEGDDNFTNLNNDKLESVSEDLNPQLGGNLDVNEKTLTKVKRIDANLDGITIKNVGGNTVMSIGLSGSKEAQIVCDQITTGTTNQSISIQPNGTGDINLIADTVVVGDLDTNATITTYGTGDLILNTNSGTNSGSITIPDGSNSNITIAPNGTGAVLLDADAIRIGDLNTNVQLSTNGTGSLLINTNGGTNSGSLTINAGANGNITLDANGSGVIVINSTGTAISLVRRSASTGTISNSLGVQRNYTAATLSSMDQHMAALAFSMRDSAATQTFFTRIGGIYSTSNAHQIAFELSTNSFTTTTRLATMASNALLLGNTSGSTAQNLSTVTTQDLVLSTNQTTNSGTITIANGANGNITIAPNGTGDVYIDADTVRIGDSNADATITTNGTGDLILNTNSGTNSGSITIADAANGNITIAPNGTGLTKITNLQYNEAVYTAGSTTGTITPDAANGPIQSITLTGSITFNAFSNPISGQTITMIIKQPAAGGPYTLTSTMLFAGASKTLSTAADAIDILTVSYIGTTYYATLSKGYA